MRAKNYNNQVASFTPLEPQHMVRVALVEGLKPKYDNGERQRYRRLLKDYTNVDESRIDKLFDVIRTEQRSGQQENFLNALVNDVAYDSGNWKSLDYEALKKEGVIIEHNGRLKSLAGLVQETDESKVIFVPSVGGRAVSPEDEPDYFKHIDWRSKLVLNGPDVVKRFALDNGIELPDNYLSNGRMTNEVLDLLEQNGFYFTEALKTAIEVLKQPEYKDRVITALAIKRKDGTELRLHPHDFLEAAEFYSYCLEHKANIIETLGNKLTQVGDKYHGANTFAVPKRIPFRRKGFNKVEFHYMPDIQEDGEHPLDWMSTRATCDCPHALNMRNFEERRGKTTRVVETMDTHANMVFLAMLKEKQIGISHAVNNMSPIPTEELSVFIDKTRYNLVQEFTVMEENSIKTKRTRVGEVNIEKIINELAKNPEWTFERMYYQPGKVGRRFLRQMYI